MLRIDFGSRDPGSKDSKGGHRSFELEFVPFIVLRSQFSATREFLTAATAVVDKLKADEGSNEGREGGSAEKSQRRQTETIGTLGKQVGWPALL